MKYAAARMQNGKARFFAGRYHHIPAPAVGCFKPYVTGAPDRAKEYDDEVVAQAIANFLNFLDAIHTGRNTLPWKVMSLPERRQS